MQEPSPSPIWVGVDVGTQGVRTLAVTAAGRVAGRGSAPLTGRRDGTRHEQRPDDWWTAVTLATRRALRGLPPRAVRGLAVCSTSGTVLLTDASGRPLTEGVMYDDGRATAEAHLAQELGAALWHRLGHRVQPSWALAKVLWLARERPGGLDPAAARLAHQADLIAGRLVGAPVATDASHALKTGYDLLDERWPRELHDRLGLPATLFPEVVRSGTVLGTVGAKAAEETGLPAGTPVIAGMTDGCAAQLGSGALRAGQWNSVLGTTLVLKGVTARPVRDPAGVMYSHRGLDGTWLPGGASSVGAGVFAGVEDLPRLDALAARYEPSSAVAYPLVSAGERFPFLAPEARGFVLGTPLDEGDGHAALLQGVALVERLALDYVAQLGAAVEGPVTLTGGAVRSDYWSQLRADVLGRPVLVPEHADAALGMAVLAAHGTTPDRSPAEVAGAMVRIRTVLEPRPGMTERFAAPYHRLLDELRQRGWLPAEVAAWARARE
ncbi:FGGY-family carbohydrate kinase [Actinomadura algeriensis]|uniref:Sugar (Pentulose or hexulose) kinase n=1 Tax=Actinomadura algeriensis TaxID=1679523 RepID=A0ABR9JJA2_9ACTN|nr:FGGY family carbohydrate kinase [Actinomadura algeriensis]MBE1530627.1 sugar (pentulose or hexulose) kinase [Actinomadura algeriensis]